MEPEIGSAFEGIQRVCMSLRNLDFLHHQTQKNMGSCLWKKDLYDGVSLVIEVGEKPMTLWSCNDLLSFKASLVIEGSMIIEILDHDLQCEEFAPGIIGLEEKARLLSMRVLGKTTDIQKSNAHESHGIHK
ncbi:hypothetical protein ACI2KR_09150 [Pseudomonas luteola]